MLLAWLDEPAEDRGIRFLQPDGQWEFWSYPRLAALSRQIAGALVALGVRPGEVVALVERTGPHLVAGLFGTLLAGATAAPLAPPGRFQNRSAAGAHLAGVFQAVRPAVALCHPDVLSGVTAAGTAVGVRAVPTAALLAGADGRCAPAPIAPAPIAVVQCTSGTSGQVRGVRLPCEALMASIGAIRTWLEMTPADATASWLPLHHDMGLVGCLLTPVVTGSDLWLMSPEEFVRRPVRYLECFGRHGARLTAMPGFGLDHITRHVRPDALAGMDFSRWRAVILGAERLVPRGLDRFVELCGPFGLSRETLRPAYGLAEATLAVTGLPLGTGWRVASPTPPGGAPAVGCGTPLTGVRVRVVDERGAPVRAGVPGQIVVTGPAVAAGYMSGSQLGSSTICRGVVHTGDAGFLLDGELFVLGRRGDSVKIRGRSVFAADLDAVLAAGLGVPTGRVATVLGQHGDRDTVAVVFERARPEWLSVVPGLLRPFVEGADVVVLDVPLGGVPRTTSGKPRRARLWQAYLRGDLGERGPDGAVRPALSRGRRR